MKRAFPLAVLFLLASVMPAPSWADEYDESCADLGNRLRRETSDPSALLRSFGVWGVRECDLFNGTTMCFRCEGGILYIQRNPKTGRARIGPGCPCHSRR
jgi:hypothetical protein